jgi:hypothetical protein
MFITIVILDYLDKDTKWRDDGYPQNELIRSDQKPEESLLTYDGTTKQVTLHNPTTNKSYHIVDKTRFPLKVNYPPETILQFAVGVYNTQDWFEIIS